MRQTNPLAPPLAGTNALRSLTIDLISERERVSDRYWSQKDSLNEMRIWWRACTVRHILHLLPGETILELACGSGRLTRALRGVSRGECPITAATFDRQNDLSWIDEGQSSIEGVQLTGFPGELHGREFDYVIATNILDHACAVPLLTEVQRLLKPGGRLLFFETNPWNPVFQLRKRVSRVLPLLRRGDERHAPQPGPTLRADLGAGVCQHRRDLLRFPLPAHPSVVAAGAAAAFAGYGEHPRNQVAGRDDPASCPEAPPRLATAGRADD